MVKIDNRETKSITTKMVWQPSMVLFEPDAGTDFNLVQHQIELGCQYIPISTPISQDRDTFINN